MRGTTTRYEHRSELGAWSGLVTVQITRRKHGRNRRRINVATSITVCLYNRSASVSGVSTITRDRGEVVTDETIARLMTPRVGELLEQVRRTVSTWKEYPVVLNAPGEHPTFSGRLGGGLSPDIIPARPVALNVLRGGAGFDYAWCTACPAEGPWNMQTRCPFCAGDIKGFDAQEWPDGLPRDAREWGAKDVHPTDVAHYVGHFDV